MSETLRAVPSSVRPRTFNARLRPAAKFGVPVSTGGTGAMEAFQCEGCGDVIGVYEPLVVCSAQYARMTSRAAEPSLQENDGPHYHRECYTGM